MVVRLTPLWDGDGDALQIPAFGLLIRRDANAPNECRRDRAPLLEALCEFGRRATVRRRQQKSLGRSCYFLNIEGIFTFTSPELSSDAAGLLAAGDASMSMPFFPIGDLMTSPIPD